MNDQPKHDQPSFAQQMFEQPAQQPPVYAPQPAPQPPFQQGAPQPQPMMGGYPQYQQGYPQQPMPYQQPMMQAAPINVQTVNVTVGGGAKQHGFISRALYFGFVGWWLGLVWLHIGFFLCGLIVTLPLGLMMLNRLPQVMTLKPGPQQQTSVNVSTVAVGGIQTTNVNVSTSTNQHSFLIRALYFVFIGSWVGYLWALLAYSCMVSLVLLPVGVVMFNRLPAVLTLAKQ